MENKKVNIFKLVLFIYIALLNYLIHSNMTAKKVFEKYEDKGNKFKKHCIIKRTIK